MTGHILPHCPKTDAVLALHLDGDLDGDAFSPSANDAARGGESGYEFACGQTLQAHWRDCPTCQTALRRARRLDAALAKAAGAGLVVHAVRSGAALGEVEARWFATIATAVPSVVPSVVPSAVATAVAEPAPVAKAVASAKGPTSRHRSVAVWFVVATVAAAVLLSSFFGSAAAADPVHAVIAAEISAGRATAVVVAEPQPARVVAPTPPPVSTLLATSDAVRRLRLQQEQAAADPQAGISSPEALARRVAASQAMAGERLHAATQLLAACRPFAPAPQVALRALVGALAGCGDVAASDFVVHGRLLDLVRDDRHAVGLLAAELVACDGPGVGLTRDHCAAVAMAARLQIDQLDRLLRRLVRRHPDVLEVVATALRCGARERGGAVLLLDLWRELLVRDLAVCDPHWAQLAFLGQPPAVFAEVRAELKVSRMESRRVQCLLALGCASDGDTVAVLLAHARCQHHEEAHAAAFALSGLAHADLMPLVAHAKPAESFLLRAALARAGHESAREWIEGLALSPTERHQLHRGPLSEFPGVASWFRDRGTASD